MNECKTARECNRCKELVWINIKDNQPYRKYICPECEVIFLKETKERIGLKLKNSPVAIEGCYIVLYEGVQLKLGKHGKTSWSKEGHAKNAIHSHLYSIKYEIVGDYHKAIDELMEEKLLEIRKC